MCVRVVWCALEHLDGCGIHTLMFATPWFMSMMTSLPDWDAVLMAFDLFFLEGRAALFRMALAVLQEAEAALLEKTGLEQVLPLLQSLPRSLVAHAKLRRTAVYVVIAMRSARVSQEVVVMFFFVVFLLFLLLR